MLSKAVNIKSGADDHTNAGFKFAWEQNHLFSMIL